MVGSIVFIDSRVSAKSSSVSFLPADTGYFILDDTLDGIGQMLELLSGFSDLDSIHIVSHGSPGSITIGSTVLDSCSISDYSTQLTAIGRALHDGGDILFYGCDVGSGPSGSSFIDSLSEAFGADVAASDNATGSLLAGGDFALEVSTGEIEAQTIIFSDDLAGLLGTSGPSVTEFSVNTHTEAAQTTPAIATLADGSFVAVWSSSGQDGSNNGVYAQRYSTVGLPEGNEFRVNTRTSNHQQNAAIASLENGGFVVAWQSYLQDGKSYGIYAQRYDASGNPVGAEFRVNSYTEASQSAPSVTGLDDGGFAIVWQSDGQDGDGTGIYMQRYDSTGITVGTESVVNTHMALSQSAPTVASLENGGFAVVWQSDGQDGDGTGIFMQRYDSTGTAAGNEQKVNTWTTSNQTAPVITSLADGRFVVVWQSNAQDGSYWGVYAQLFESNGLPTGSEFRVNTTTTYSQITPAAASLADGGFVVVWSSSGQDGSEAGIYVQRFDSSGKAEGAETQVNTFVTGDQIDPAVTTLNDGGFMVVWQSRDQDGSEWGIYALRFDANGDPVQSHNASPTGALLIHGVSRSGETLTADTSALADADGLGNFSYQWYADGTAIAQATSATCTLTDTEIGKSMSVTVSYTDGHGVAEEVNSAATDPVDFSILKLNAERTASGTAVAVWLKAHTIIDVMDIEFSYLTDGAIWTGFDQALEQWEMLSAEPQSGTIAIAGYAADFELLDSENDILIGTFTFTFTSAEPDFAFSVTDYTILSNTTLVSGDIALGTLPEINSPELVGTIPDQTVQEDSLFSAVISETLFDDPDSGDGDTLRYSATLADGGALPAWLHFDADSRTFSGTPLNEHVGTLVIRVTATDQSGLTRSDLFSLTVSNTNDAPVVAVPIPDAVVNEKAPLSLSIPASHLIDPDTGDSLVWSATRADGSALPAWIHFDTTTRSFSGTPGNAEVGTIGIAIKAADTNGADVTDTFILTVNNVNDTPQGEVTIIGSAVQGQTVTANTDNLSDPDGLGVFSYQWYAGGSAITGANEKNYTPAEAEVGKSLSVAVSYTDGHGTDERAVSTTTGTVTNANDTPSGAPVITGTVRQGETLTVLTSGISDADGMSGVFSYQWYSGNTAITGATSSSYVPGVDDVGKKISVNVSWSDGHGTSELLASSATAPVDWPVSSINGAVSFWKTGIAITEVAVEIKSSSVGTEGNTGVIVRQIELHADGSRTLELSVKSETPIESLQLEFVLPEGSEASWQTDTSLPSGWSSLASSTNGTAFSLGGFSLNETGEGMSRLGTLTLSAPDNPEWFELSLVDGELGTNAVAPFDIISATETNDDDGSYLITELTRSNYVISAKKTADGSLSSAITAADALAALKIAVGMNPNANSSEVSNYQYLAADIDHDGKIRASDAIGILKMAVGHSNATEQEWLFVTDAVEEVTMSRKSVDWDAAGIEVALAEDQQLELIGVLMGDINGSWVA